MYSSILFIDDDFKILNSFKRSLTPEFKVFVAESPEEGLRMLKETGPFSVLVSDMRMPGMNGVEVLCRAREINPDTVRVLLTGYADQQAAIDAVNKGNVFRFLTKPCGLHTLVPVLEEGIRRYQLAMIEKGVAERTLSGVAGLLNQILTMVNPAAQRKACRLKRYCRHMACACAPQDRWVVETAAMLSQLGSLAMAPGGAAQGEEPIVWSTSNSDQGLYEVASRLLMHVPRFERIVAILSLLDKPIRHVQWNECSEQERSIHLCRRILQTAIGLDAALTAGHAPAAALSMLRAEPDRYDPACVALLAEYDFGLHNEVLLYVRGNELTTRMILAEDLRANDGVLLATKGQPVSESLLRSLRTCARGVGYQEPVGVLLSLLHFDC
jgi:ActR/RegA family two-component response regulator